MIQDLTPTYDPNLPCIGGMATQAEASIADETARERWVFGEISCSAE